MGGTSKQTTQQQSTSEPWKEAKPMVMGLLDKVGDQFGSTQLTGHELDALNQWQNMGSAGNPFAPQMGKVANDLLGGGPDRTGMVQGAYDDYKRSTESTAAGDYLDPNKNPFFANMTDTVNRGVMNNVNSMFASAGRDFSGAHANTAARGVADATGGLFSDQYNRERQNQIAAQSGRFGAGGATAGMLSGLDQQKFGNQQAGIGAANAANQASLWGPQQVMASEAARRGIPMDMLQRLVSMGVPLASLGQQSQGSSTSYNYGSPAQTAMMWTQAFKNMLPSGPMPMPGGG